LNCTLCDTRKEKRFCPALHARICAACCGTHRELILDCPNDCSYLKQAREYDRFRAELFEDERWFAHVQIEEDLLDTHPVLLAGLVESITQSALGNHSLRDRDVIEALTALVRSFETRANSGLHYEPTNPSLTQQTLIEELREVIENCVQEGGKLGTPHLRDGDALKGASFRPAAGPRLQLWPPALARVLGLPASRVPARG
jgi:hypothetical protein